MKYRAAIFTLSVLLIHDVALAQKRPLAAADIYNRKEVRDPQRSPDGKWVSDVKGGVSDYEWAPDGKRLVFVVSEPDPRDPKDDDKAEGDKKKTPPPIVIDRYQFKRDVDGYLRNARTHLYLFDVATKKAEAITSGTRFDESSPAWSPDGTKIAFVSKR